MGEPINNFSDLPPGATVLHAPTFSDIPPGAQILYAPTASQSGNLSLGKTEMKPDSWGSQLLRSLLSALPATGMMAGSAIGATAGPEGSVLGAGIGGMGGEAARQLAARGIYGTGPDTSGQAASGIATQGEVGMGSELGGIALQKLAPILKNSATKQMTDVLHPAKIINKAKAQEVAPGLVDRRVMASSRQGMEQRLADETAQAGQAVQAVENPIIAAERAGAPKQIEASKIKDSLLKLRASTAIPGTGGAVTGNDALAGAIDQQISKLDSLVQNQGGLLSTESAVGLRRILDNQVTAASKGAYVLDDASSAMTEARKEFANAIRRQLSEAHPDLAKVNAEYHFWRTALDVMHDTNVRKLGQTGLLPSLSTFVKSVGGGALYGYASHDPINAFLVTTALNGIGKAAETPAWNTVAAVTKGRIADALAAGNLPEAIKLIPRIASAPETQAHKESGQ